MRGQPGFFDIDDRLKRLSDLWLTFSKPSMIGVPGWPIRFGNQRQDSGASNLSPPRTNFFLQQQREVEHRICVVGGSSQSFTQAFDCGFRASLLISRSPKALIWAVSPLPAALDDRGRGACLVAKELRRALKAKLTHLSHAN